MTPDAVRAAVLAALREVAPEADPAALDPAAPIREQLDLDSIDFLRFLTGIDRRLHVAVAEPDYPELATLDRAVAWLLPRV